MAKPSKNLLKELSTKQVYRELLKRQNRVKEIEKKRNNLLLRIERLDAKLLKICGKKSVDEVGK